MTYDVSVLGDDLLLDLLERAEQVEADCMATAWNSVALAANAAEATRLASTVRAEVSRRMAAAAELMVDDGA